MELEGCHFLTEDDYLVGMIGLYLRREIRDITKTVIEEGGLLQSGIIFPSSKRGSLQMSIPQVVLTRTMDIVSETNCSVATLSAKNKAQLKLLLQ